MLPQIKLNEVEDGSLKGPNLGGVETDATLWVMVLQLLFSIGLSTLLILIAFWLEFGELRAFAYGFAVFLGIFQILMVFGFRFRDRAEFKVNGPARFGVLDKIAGFWLVTCAFGAFFAWISGNLGVYFFPAYRTAFYCLAAVFSIVLPVATMLPNLRYLSGKAMMVQIPLLTLVTILPVMVGLYYLWQTT